jgi:hypothetical protein
MDFQILPAWSRTLWLAAPVKEPCASRPQVASLRTASPVSHLLPGAAYIP